MLIFLCYTAHVREYKTPEAQRERARQYYWDNKEERLAYAKAKNAAVRADPEKRVKSAIYQARSRAKRRKLPCHLTPDMIHALLDTCGNKCQMTGVDFSWSPDPHCPNAMVIDRIDSSLGYTEDNIQLVTNIYNTAKRHWNDDDVLAMARALLNKAC